MPNKGSNSASHKTAQSQHSKPNYLSQNEKATSPRTFQSAINARLDNPYISLFRLGIRILQLCFALGSGISYAIELSHGSTASAFIYSQVAFGLTILILVFDAITLRSYRFTFVIEWTLCILWLALFGVFYVAYLGDYEGAEPDFRAVDIGRMKRVVWIDLVNFLLWMGSAVFSTVMCCSGVKATIRGKMDSWRARRKSNPRKGASQMEEGVVRGPARPRAGDALPTYEELAAAARPEQ